MDLISIIMPVYNAESYLKKCLDSVLKQSYENFELIIVDDGSTDHSREIIEQYASIDKRIIPYYNENHGVSYTRNFAIKKSKGKFVAFVDSDDIISEDFIEVLYLNMILHNADMSTVNTIGESKFSTEYFSDGCTNTFENDEMFSGLFNCYSGFLCNKLYKKSIIKKYKLFLNNEVAVCEDLLFNVEYLKYCKKVVSDSGIKYFYRQIPNSATNRLDNTKWFDSIKVYEMIMDLLKDNENKALRDKIKGIYALSLCEAMYRMRFIKEIDKDLKASIKEKKRQVKAQYKTFDIKLNVKLFLFEHFPNIVMKYRRRKL